MPYIPQLELDAATWDFWQERLDGFRGARVGLLWSDDRSTPGGQYSSVSPNALAFLRSVPGVSFIGLQKSERATVSPFKFGDLGSAFDDANWTDMAAILTGLDLVIGVDSTTVHLAGALGVPVWVALASTPHWRWLLEDEKCPWYPTMRLFRQPSPGDWDSVFKRIAAELNISVRGASIGAGKKRRQSGFESTGAICLDNA
jgi:hypothetical protein